MCRGRSVLCTLYCRPDANVLTPSFFAFSSRKARPAGLVDEASATHTASRAERSIAKHDVSKKTTTKSLWEKTIGETTFVVVTILTYTSGVTLTPSPIWALIMRTLASPGSSRLGPPSAHPGALPQRLPRFSARLSLSRSSGTYTYLHVPWYIHACACTLTALYSTTCIVITLLVS